MRNVAGLVTSCVALALLCMAPGNSVAQEPEPAGETETEPGTLDDLIAAYESLAGRLGQGSGEAVERVQSDIENLGDWEYRIVELASDSTDDMAAELNALGDERWEVFWVERVPRGVRVYLKRPSVSYLSRVPLSTLLRLLAIGM